MFSEIQHLSLVVDNIFWKKLLSFCLSSTLPFCWSEKKKKLRRLLRIIIYYFTHNNDLYRPIVDNNVRKTNTAWFACQNGIQKGVGAQTERKQNWSSHWRSVENNVPYSFTNIDSSVLTVRLAYY